MKLIISTDWAGKVHSRYALPPQFISQMFFANITAVPVPPVSPSTLPSSSSTTCSPRLHFDRDLIPYIVNTTTTTTTTTITPTIAATTIPTNTGIAITKSVIQDSEKRLAADRRAPIIS